MGSKPYLAINTNVVYILRYRIRFGQYNLSAPLGSFEEKIVDIREVFVHKKYNIPWGSRYYDIAVIKFDRIPFSQSIKPICMLQKPINSFLRTAVSPGWGSKVVDGRAQAILHEVDLTIFDKR